MISHVFGLVGESGLEIATILVAYATKIKPGRLKNIIGRTRASAENIGLIRTSCILKDVWKHGESAPGVKKSSRLQWENVSLIALSSLVGFASLVGLVTGL